MTVAYHVSAAIVTTAFCFHFQVCEDCWIECAAKR